MALIQIDSLTGQVCHRPNERELFLIEEDEYYDADHVSMFYKGKEIKVYFSKNANVEDGYCYIPNTLPISFCGNIFIHFNATNFLNQVELQAFVRELTENLIFNSKA